MVEYKAAILLSLKENASKKLDGLGSKMAGLAKTAGKMLLGGLTLAAGGLALVGKSAIKAGMDAVESENLFSVSMGKMEKAARSWSEDLSKRLGVNEYELRRTTATLNAMTKSMGLSEKEAFKVSTGMSQLAYDLASFYNLPVEQAFEKLRSGLSGEAEPLKQIGILVNENTIKTWAYANGLAKQGEELTEQQKVMARYGAIMEQTSMAQGDLARTIDSPTNKIRIMGEKLDMLKTKVGTALIPIASTLADKIMPLLDKAADWANKNADDLQKAIEDGLGAIGDTWDEVKGKADEVISFLNNLSDLAEKGDWEQFGENIGKALNSGLTKLAGMGAKLGDVVMGWFEQVDWTAVGRSAVAVAAGFALGFVAGLLDPAVWWDVVSKNWLTILEVIIGIIALPESWLGRLGIALAKIPIAGKVLKWLVENIHDVGRKILEPIAKLFSDLGSTFMGGLLKGLGTEGGKLLPKMRGLVDDAIKGVKDRAETFYLRGMEFMERMGRSIAEHGPVQVVQGVRTIISKVDEVVAGLVSRAVNYGRNFIVDLGRGISTNGPGHVIQAIKNLIDDVAAVLAKAASSAVQWGKNIISSLAEGLRSIHVPLPHIKVSWGSIGVGNKSISIPNFDVNWYAKGGVFTKPVVPGFGDVDEAIVPFEGPHARRIAGLIAGEMQGAGTIINITITGNTIASDYDIDKIGDKLIRKLRLVGVKI